MGNLLLGYDLLFGKDLHRVDSLGVPLPHLEHLAERSATDKLEELEVPGSQCALVLSSRPRVRVGSRNADGITNLVRLERDLDPHFAGDRLILQRR